jgi:hypothetical protein
MGKRVLVALTVAVWLAAAGSAAALTYELNRPLTVRETGSPPRPVFATARDTNVIRTSVPAPVLQLPTVTIAGRAAHRAVPDRTSRPPTDIAAMRCKDWQELQMGSGRVQVCE